MAYLEREIDAHLLRWKESTNRKPLLLRGARQVGKSRSIRNLGSKFTYFVEVNFEKQPELKSVFARTHDVKEICADLSALFSTSIKPGETLLFLDEIQSCPDALKSLWFFKEDYPELHVAAAGSLLEFALKGISSYGVGRIKSMFMYPFSFREFLKASGRESWIKAIDKADCENPIFEALHSEIVRAFRTFILVGGMPASVAAWIETHDYNNCISEQSDIQQSYYDDFAKYADKIDIRLLRNTLVSVVNQCGSKFVYSRVEGGYRAEDVKKALGMLLDAGIIKEIRYTAANGLPLGAQTNDKFRKYIYLDTGLLLRVLSLEFGDSRELTELILAGAASDLVNRGDIAEMVAGWEIVKAGDVNFRHDLFYWENIGSGGSSEVDFIICRNMRVLPIEIKSGTSGKMKSLRYFMEKKNVDCAIRSSLENFGRLNVVIDEKECSIDIVPLYAIASVVGRESVGAVFEKLFNP